MKKRGALFYIIDAFVAAGIIAITLTIIFSSQINVPETEQIKDSLNDYYIFLSKTKIYQAPGTIAEDIIMNERISDIETSILGAAIELVNTEQTTLAEQLISEITNIILAGQYGINITLNDGSETILFTRNEERKEKAKSVFYTKRIVMHKQNAIEKMSWQTITTNGNAACGLATCLYVTDDTTYQEDCFANRNGWNARCSSITGPTLTTTTVEVSIW